MLHDFSPFAIHFSGDFGVRWYGLAYLGGFIVGYLLVTWIAKRQRAELTAEMVGDLVTYVAVGTLVGGRLGYCLFYSPDLFLKFKDSFPFWGVLAVNEGGMASHGGMIGIVAACILYARKTGLNSLYLFDLVAVVAPIGVFFGRLANFINGELVGRVASPEAPWTVRFPQDILQWPSADPSRLAQLTDVVDKMGIPQTQWQEWMTKLKTDHQVRDQVYALLNTIIEKVQQGDEAVKQALAPLLDPRHPSQLYAALGEGVFLFLVLFFLWRSARKPGLIGATFLWLYGVVRIGGEVFRLPDAHIGYQWLGLTRGQWLSMVMVFCGLVLTFWWSRSGLKPIPGWGKLDSIKLNRKK